MTNNIKFSAITANLMVDNVNRTVDFYKDVLGFEVVMTVPASGSLNWAMMRRDGVSLMFQERSNLLAEYPVLADRSPGGGLTQFINVDDVVGLHGLLKDKVEVCAELHDTFYGSKEFAILDCNGFVLTFAQS